MIKKKSINNKQISKILKQNYATWKKSSLENKGYFIVFNEFKKSNKLKDMSGNALKLFIYLGIHSDNSTGEVWHGNKRISDYFNKSERTIRLWMQELESLNLIKRLQLEFNKESHTFLQPYYSKDLFSSEKYIYVYRLKNYNYRKEVDLTEYKDTIKPTITRYLKNTYVTVKKDYFEIMSFSPIENKELRNIGKLIKSKNPIFETFTKTYQYKKADGSIGYNHHLFERVKNKKFLENITDNL